MTNPSLHVRVLSPQKLLLETMADSVSSKNLQGNFDILPQHTNFITMIENTPVVVRVANQKPISLTFPLAIILVMENNVSIYTYIQPDLEKK